MGQKVEGLSEEERRLVQVYDVDAEPLAVDEGPHLLLGVLVAQVNPGIEQVLDCEQIVDAEKVSVLKG